MSKLGPLSGGPNKIRKRYRSASEHSRPGTPVHRPRSLSELPYGMDQIPVVAAVIWRDGRVLLGRRPDDKRHGGLWEFPGGKIQRDETNLDAVRRELTEELRLETISVGDTLYESRDSGSPFVIRFVEVEVRGEPLALEHEELRWVKPGALTALRLAPCDTRCVVEHLLESLA